MNEAIDWKYSGEKYEFIMEFLEMKIHWKQTKYPLNESGTKAEGFEDFTIRTAPSSYWDRWNGLGQSKVSCALLHGLSNTTNWYFAIGTIPKCGGYGETNFPGYNDNNKFVRLWMRINPIRVHGFSTRCSMRCSTKVYFIFIICFVS